MSKKSLVILTIVITFVLLLLAYPFTLSAKPSFCRLCHSMRKEFRTWRASSHQEVTCVLCHQQKGATGFFIFRLKRFQMVLAQLSGLYNKPLKAAVKNENCLSCHQEVVKKTIVKKALRVSHKEFLKSGSKCSNCHNTVAHKVVSREKYPQMDKCLSCHDGKKASKNCNLCHLKKPKESRYPQSLWRITHGKNWEKTHGMGNLQSCQLCHPQDYCRRCHQIEGFPHPPGTWPARHSKVALKQPEACGKCHYKSFCLSCHRLEMPHSLSWLPEHDEQTQNLGQETCFKCHIKYTCEECHLRHIHPGLSPKKIKELQKWGQP